MDLSPIIEVGLSAVAGAASGIATVSFFFGRKVQKLDELDARAKRMEHEIEQTRTDVNTIRTEDAESWTNINRDLGQIQGYLGIQTPYRPPLKSR